MTAPTEDLIARLDRHIAMSPQGDGATRLYRNPDGPAAAQAIRALQQEVERLMGDLAIEKARDADDVQAFQMIDVGETAVPDHWRFRCDARKIAQFRLKARSALTGSAQG